MARMTAVAMQTAAGMQAQTALVKSTRASSGEAFPRPLTALPFDRHCHPGRNFPVPDAIRQVAQIWSWNLRAFCRRYHMLHDKPEHLRQRDITYKRLLALGDLSNGPYRS
ncbi:hypothetical protein GCM10010869_34150 [Mesorhizobium tianshanense]|nr:hypothetical protein GCM10010869_34150 [Mesorhizobium tianshanense]